MSGVSNLGNILSQRFMLTALRDQVNNTQREIRRAKSHVDCGYGHAGRVECNFLSQQDERVGSLQRKHQHQQDQDDRDGRGDGPGRR